MTDLEAKILPYVFMALLGFVILNLLMNFCLYSFTKIHNIKMLCWYWFSLLLTFAIQGQCQYGELPIILSYGSSVVPSVLISVIIFDTIGKKAPIRLYLNLWLVAMAVTPLLHLAKLNFTLVSLPMSLALGFIPLYTAYHILHHESHEATILHKFMGVFMVFTFIHFLNFSFFRMVPGTQIWGHGVSLGIYQVFSVSIFALVLENFSRKEKERLREQVELKTAELTKALNVKDTLFRMVLHDIATPIQSQLWTIQLLKENRTSKFDLLKKLSDMTNLIKNVVEQVRSIEAINSGKIKIELTPVNLESCLEDIKTIFEEQLKNKNIELEIRNHLSPGTKFFADQTVFTTSVLGNLISNGIKFSPENSKLIFHAYESSHEIIIELEDQGVGMPKELAYAIFDPTKKSTRRGTHGEPGTGFGMVQVKSYVEHFGGQIDVESRPMDIFPMNHGTKVTLTMNRSEAHLH
jgi:signal transduction histidine kinase